jgi:MurNAc alpha-1-phosphate uridylyltransferase
MSPEALMIFAAGRGTRMGLLTRDRPKPLIEVAGMPLIDHALALAKAAGIDRIVINCHAHGDQLEAHITVVAPDVRIAREPVLLETGGGLLAARPLLEADTAFTLNADMVWTGPNPLETLARAWPRARALGARALLCLVARDRATGHPGQGDFFRAADGRLTRRGDSKEADFVYAGAQIMKLSALDGLAFEAFSLNLVWNRLLEERALFGVVHSGGWVDVGTPAGIALAEAELAR